MRNLKPWQAFKTFAIIFSFTVNFILVIVLLVAAPLILPIVNDIAKPIVGGLNNSFVDMSTATINRTIQVNDTIPISFTLPLSATTNVVLAERVHLEGVPATFLLPGGGGSISGNVTLDLPKDLILPVKLALDVDVDQQVPVSLAVGVQIPLSETELGRPFGTLVNLFSPINELLNRLPSSNQDLFERITQSTTGPVQEPVVSGQ